MKLLKKLGMGTTALVALFAAGVFVSAGGSPAAAAARCTTIITTIGTVTSTVISTVTQTVTVTTGATTTTTTPPPACDATLNAGGNVSSFFNALTPGQTGCLRAGSYGSVSTYHNLSTSGTTTSRITLTSYPGETATVMGLVGVAGSYVTLSGLTLDGSNDTYSTTYCNPPGRMQPSPDLEGTGDILDHNNITQTTIKGNGVGIGFDHMAGHGDNAIVRYNKIHDVGSCQAYDHLIYLADGNNVQIYGNWMWGDAHGWGVQIYPYPNDARIYSNVIDAAGAGFLFSDNGDGGTTGNQAYNNVVINSVGVPAPANVAGACLGGIGPTGSGNTFTTNDCFNNPGGIGSQTNVAMSGNITSNPMFVNSAANDYRLQAGSPVASWGLWDGS